MSERLNLLVQSSESYAVFAGVMLTSLFENNKDVADIKVHLLTSDMSQKNRDRFMKMAEQFHRVIEFYDMSEVDKFCEEQFLPKYHGSYALYYKLFALSVIKDEIERLIYLDADIIVTGSIKYLQEVDLLDNVFGACIEMIADNHKKLIGLKQPFYYNTGMLVFNVRKWKSEKCLDRLVKHITEVQAQYPLGDQDMLNVVFQGMITTLPLKYNFIMELLWYDSTDFVKRAFDIQRYYSEEEFIDARENSVIWQCNVVMNLRPWVENTDHPAKDLWLDYMQKSLWNDFKPVKQKKALPFKIQTFLYKYLPNKFYAFIYRNVSSFLQKQRAKKAGLI